MVELILKNVLYFQYWSQEVCSPVAFTKSCLEAAAVPQFKGCFPLVQTSQSLRSEMSKAILLGWQIQLYFEVAPFILFSQEVFISYGEPD